MAREISQTVALIGKRVRSFLNDTDQNSEQHFKELHQICDVLNGLLSTLLLGDGRWSKYRWIDATIPYIPAAFSSDELMIQGDTIWGERRTTKEWIEPSVIAVSLVSGSDEVKRIHIRMGDAYKGLKAVEYGLSVRRNAPRDIQDWIFELSWPLEETKESNSNA